MRFLARMESYAGSMVVALRLSTLRLPTLEPVVNPTPGDMLGYADWGKTGGTSTLIMSARSKVARCWASLCSAQLRGLVVLKQLLKTAGVQNTVGPEFELFEGGFIQAIARFSGERSKAA